MIAQEIVGCQGSEYAFVRVTKFKVISDYYGRQSSQF